MPIYEKKVTALIGPSGCGKSTYLRCFNRMHDLYPGNRYDGEIRLLPGQHQPAAPAGRSDRGAHAHQHGVPEAQSFPQVDLRKRRVRLARARRARRGRRWTRRSKRRCATPRCGTRSRTASRIWRSISPAASSSACASPRALATEPEILLFDEPTSALDPIATASIEELIADLKDKVTILIVTHNMQQAARVSDYTAYMYLGETHRIRRHRHHFHQAQEQSHRRLHYRTLRLRSEPYCSGGLTRSQVKCAGTAEPLHHGRSANDGVL